jgi:hypothetical protein
LRPCFLARHDCGPLLSPPQLLESLQS